MDVSTIASQGLLIAALAARPKPGEKTAKRLSDERTPD